MSEKILFEKTFTSEKAAHTSRRSFIARGWQVSLIGFDTSRNVYAFDVYYPN